jgi:hypothetical protein
MNRIVLARKLREIACCLDMETDYTSASIVREAVEFILSTSPAKKKDRTGKPVKRLNK